MAVTVTKRNVLLLAALLGFFTSLLIYRFLKSIQTTRQAEMVTTVVATHDIEPRTVIEPWMIRAATVPRAQVPDGVGLSRESVTGKVALVKLLKDMPVGAKDVGDRGASLGLAYVIPDSMRAVTVAVDPVIGVAGFLKPGDRVDVVATFDNGQSAIARTVLQNVQLLALGSKVKPEQVKKDDGKPASDEKDTATLVVTPEQAERLVLAENQGKLRLVLRGINDYAETPTKGVSCASMSGYGAPARVTVTQAPSSQPARPSTSAGFSIPAIMRQLSAARAPAVQPRVSLRSSPINVNRPAKPVSNPAPPANEIELIRGTTVEKVQVGSATVSGSVPVKNDLGSIVKAQADIKEVRDNEKNLR